MMSESMPLFCLWAVVCVRVLCTHYSAIILQHPHRSSGHGGWVLALKLDLSLPSGRSLELCTNNSQM